MRSASSPESSLEGLLRPANVAARRARVDAVGRESRSAILFGVLKIKLISKKFGWTMFDEITKLENLKITAIT